VKLVLVGYTYRGFPMAEAFRRASSYGYDGVEVRSFSDFSTSTADKASGCLRSAAELGRRYGLELCAVFEPVTVRPDGGLEDVDRIKRIADTINDVEVGLWHTRLNLADGPDSAADAAPADFDRAAEGAARLVEICGSLPVAFETHMGTVHDTAAGAREILRRCESVAVSVDFANLLIANRCEDLLAVSREFADRLGYVHLKNLKFTGSGYRDYDWSMPLELGVIDYRSVLSHLSAHGAIAAGIEFCGEGDRSYFARRDIAYVREILAEREAE
jgi:sugar phosphate isomerase/epimerase